MHEAEIEAIKDAMRRGELLEAYDIAQAALVEDGAANQHLVYLRSLALARMGDADGALVSLAAIEANGRPDEDTLALTGRILKDLASRAPPAARAGLYGQASEAYRFAHECSKGHFSLINAATTALLAGRGEDAAAMARVVLEMPEIVSPTEYYQAATACEALALLGRFEEAMGAISRACSLEDADLGARASTARQFAMLAAETGLHRFAALADRVRPPPVLFFAGHMFQPDPAAEAHIAEAIELMLDQTGSTIAYGGAAAGADILFAEAILRRGGELNLVLPFGVDDYLRQSVIPWGDIWCQRFAAITARAKPPVYPATAPYIGDPRQFAYGNEFAMGLTCLRANNLSTTPVHVAVRDESSQRIVAGTLSGMDLWAATGRTALTIASGPINRAPLAPPEQLTCTAEREQRSIVFTDYSGFSGLAETERPRFLVEVMGRVARALNEHNSDVLSRCTWGDALFAVISNPVSAADLALTIQELLTGEVHPAVMGLKADAGMRIAIHHGPVYCAIDPVTEERSYFGNEVTRAARIEPITPVGQVYATQAMAALLALHGATNFTTHYVGTLLLHKAFATMPMHRLARMTHNDSCAQD